MVLIDFILFNFILGNKIIYVSYIVSWADCSQIIFLELSSVEILKLF